MIFRLIWLTIKLRSYSNAKWVIEYEKAEK